ncbi:MAG: hypothetical protein R3321_00155 [Nitrososphaeraceae archaeon]|nr:hypothetical protein [Nitrososphaeraceae archaeon]
MKKKKDYHRHHIIPKSEPFNGSDKKVNLVYLTPRQHFIAHKLLYKAFPKTQAAQRAVWFMGGYDKTSKEYNQLVSNYIVSDLTKEKLSKAGLNREVSQETRDKLSKATTAQMAGMSEEEKEQWKEKISKSRSVPWTEAQRNAIPDKLPSGRDHWRLKNHPLWDREDEIYEVWINNNKPKHKKLCRLLNIKLTKVAYKIATIVHEERR